MQLLDYALVFCFNTMIFASTLWVVLRAVEKAYDVAIKAKQYERMDDEKTT